MSEALESDLDALFQLPPADMVEARNALADRLKKAGERDASARVKSLKRPAPVAWAINQVFFRERALLERARELVAHMRELQATDGVDRQQLKAAGDAQRNALQAIVDAAMRFSAAAGLATGAVQERKVFTTVQGWLGGSGEEPPGRMTRELEPSGFEAIGLLGTPAPLPAAGAPAPPIAPAVSKKPAVAATANTVVRLRAAAAVARPNAAEIARLERERAGARVAEHKQYVEWADERVTAERKKQAIAVHEVERAKRELADAEQALVDRRPQLAAREAELADKQRVVDEAERARRAAEAALAKARAEFAKLS